MTDQRLPSEYAASNRPFRLLLSNDDGYQAAGLRALLAAVKAAFEQAGIPLEAWVYAPDRDRSGASNSLTLDRPLQVKQAEEGIFYVNGTPTDCVHLAITGQQIPRPDLVISGINHGANMGDDTIYSGTVAAAMEGYLLGVPAIAFSMAAKGWRDWAPIATRAAEVVLKVVQAQRVETASDMPGALSLAAPFLWNVNFPPAAASAVTAFQDLTVTRLGKRHHAEPVIPATNPQGQSVYWIGPAGEARDAGPGTDFHAVAAGLVSITPLQIDLTRYEAISSLGAWFAQSATGQPASP